MLSFPAGEILWIADCLQDLVEVFQHYQFTLHSHFPTVDVSHQHPRAFPQLLLEPFVLDDFSNFTKHYLIWCIQAVQNFISFSWLLLRCWRKFNISQHLVNFGSKIAVQIFCFKATLFPFIPFFLFTPPTFILIGISIKFRTVTVFILSWGSIVLIYRVIDGKCTISTF